MDYSNHKKALEYLASFFNGAILYSKNRRHEPHLRISANQYGQFNIAIEKYLKDNKSSLTSSFDTRYSSSYKTFFINLPDIQYIPFPIVICAPHYKKNNKDSVVQKQLTPVNIGVTGYFNNLDTFIAQVTSGLYNISPLLSNYWKSSNKDEFVDILLKLLNQSVGKKVDYNKREIEIITTSSIGKDFGEILVAANIIKKYGNVTLNSSASASNYDLYYNDDSGLNCKINVKSGGGSGQSFSSIEKSLSTLSDQDYIKGSKAEILISILKTIVSKKEKKGSGKKIVFQLMDLGCLLEDELGVFLKKVRKEFFDNITISEETYIPKPSFEEFSELAINILIDSKLNFAGIPKGNKEKTTTYTYSKEDGPINAILFYLLTNFSKNFDQKVFSTIMKKVVSSNIEVVNVGFDSTGLVLKDNESYNYRFHYWGNFSAPLNNFLGFKIIY